MPTPQWGGFWFNGAPAGDPELGLQVGLETKTITVPLLVTGPAGGNIGYRTFNGTTDVVDVAMGNLAGSHNIPETFIFAGRMLSGVSAGGEILAQSAYDGLDWWAGGSVDSYIMNYTEDGVAYSHSDGTTADVTDGFAIYAFTRSAAGAVMRWHKAVYSGGSWGAFTHIDGTTAAGSTNDRVYPGTGTIKFGNNGPLNADFALVARCSTALSDAALDALVSGGTSYLTTWQALASLTNLWRLDGVGGADPVNDLVGTSAYSSKTGTTTTAAGFPLSDGIAASCVKTPGVGFVVKTNLLAVPATINQPAVSGSGGTQTVVCNLLTAPATINSPKVCYVAKANLLTAPVTVRSPTVVPGSVTIATNLLTAPSVVNQPKVYYVVTTNLLTAPTTVNSPTILPGSVTVVCNLLTDTATVNSPAAYHVIKTNLVADPAVVNSPTVVPGSVTIAMNLVADGATVNSPGVYQTQYVEVPVVVTARVPILETFTGADSDPLDPTRWSGSGYVWDNHGGGNGYSSAFSLFPVYEDFELTFDYYIDQTGTDYAGEFNYRVGPTSGWRVYFFANGVFFSNPNYPTDSTNLGTRFWGASPSDGPGLYHARIKVEGDNHKLRFWNDGNAEHDTWDINLNDTIGYARNDGHFSFATVDDSYIDNLQVLPGGSPEPSVGNTQYVSAPLIVSSGRGVHNFPLEQFTGDDSDSPASPWLGAGGYIFDNQLRCINGSGAIFYEDLPRDIEFFVDCAFDTDTPGNNQVFISYRGDYDQRGIAYAPYALKDSYAIQFIRDLGGGNGRVDTRYWDDGSNANITIGTNFPFADGDVLHVQVRLEGDEHQIRYWKNDNLPPEGWQIEFTDGRYRGPHAMLCCASDGDAALYDNFRVGGVGYDWSYYDSATPIFVADTHNQDFEYEFSFENTGIGTHYQGKVLWGCTDADVGSFYGLFFYGDEVYFIHNSEVDGVTALTGAVDLTEPVEGDIERFRIVVFDVPGGRILNLYYKLNDEDEELVLNMSHVEVYTRASGFFPFDGGALNQFLIEPNPVLEPMVVPPQTVEVAGLAAPATVYEPRIAQVFILEAEFLEAPSVIFEPAIIEIPRVYVGALHDPSSVYAPVVILLLQFISLNSGCGPFTVGESEVGGCTVLGPDPQTLVVATTTVNAPAVAYVVKPPLVSDPAVVNAPTVLTISQYVEANLLTAPSAVNSPQVIYIIKTNLLADPAVVNSPTITTTISSTANVVADPAVVNTPAIYYVVKPNLVADPAVVNSPTIAVGGVAVAAQVLTAPATVNTPAVYRVVKTTLIADPAVVNSPQVYYVVKMDLVAAPSTINEPALAIGAVVVKPTLVVDPAVVNAPTVTTGSVNVVVTVVADPAVVNAPAVQLLVKPGVIADPAVVNAPAVTAVARVTVGVIADPAVVNAPAVYQLVKLGVVADPAVVNSPAVYGLVKPGLVSDPAVVNSPQVLYMVKLGALSAPTTVLSPKVIYLVGVGSVISDPSTVLSPGLHYTQYAALTPVVTFTTVYGPTLLGGLKLIPLQVISFVSRVQSIGVVDPELEAGTAEQNVDIDARNPVQVIVPVDLSNTIELLYT